MTVNVNDWKRLPVADRDQEFGVDDAVTRLAEWANGNAGKFSSMFLWKSGDGDPRSKASYRLPVGDIVNGKAVLVPHAIFTAASILAGAHGGLEGVIDEKERDQLRDVVTAIYEKFQQMWGDPRTRPPWQRGMTPQERQVATAEAARRASGEGMYHEDDDQEILTIENVIVASVNSSGFSAMPIAEADRTWEAGPATQRVFEWAEHSFGKYKRAFLWWDATKPDLKTSYKLPIADIIDGELTIVPHAVSSAAARLSTTDIPDVDKSRAEGVIVSIQKRIHADDDSRSASVVEPGEGTALLADGGPLRPRDEWFHNPNLSAATPLTVTADGQVFGHLAAWNRCHSGITGQCLMAPRSAAGYKYFLNGKVLTASGSQIPVGRLTVGTGHAGRALSRIPAIEHYDNTGTAVAVVNAGEDRHGIWVAGAVVPGAAEEKVAELRRSPLSGDWRAMEGNLELVAALAVNSPGYPVVSQTASGELESLCAAGVVTADGVLHDAQGETIRLQERLDEFDIRNSELMTRIRAHRLARLDREGK